MFFLLHTSIFAVLSVPHPTSVTVAPPMGAIIAGSSPNLTCIVELSPQVDVPVTVTADWTSPHVMTTVTPTSSVMNSLTRYSIVGMINEARAGEYTCQASINSSSQFINGSGMTSGSTSITIGKVLIIIPDLLT